MTDSTHKILCVGLTGGIGCGKSTVAQLFARLGAGIIDTDAIAHQLTQAGGEAIPAIRAAFGAAYLTPAGALDRTRMRHTIFSDATARRKLESILHPLILSHCELQLAERSDASYLILVAPLLLENPAFLHLIQRVLLVSCSIQQQISRVMQRSGLSEPEIRAIIAQQLPQAERIARSDDIIQNDGTCDALEHQVLALHQYYLNITTTI